MDYLFYKESRLYLYSIDLEFGYIFQQLMWVEYTPLHSHQPTPPPPRMPDSNNVLKPHHFILSYSRHLKFVKPHFAWLFNTPRLILGLTWDPNL